MVGFAVGARANIIHDSIACGRWITLTATPDKGYHFVRWSDGNTDNPRRMFVEDDIAVEAEFARDCQSPEPPVLRLYDWILMLNVDSLHAAGWQFGEEDVYWFRVVGGADAPDHLTDDQWMGTGYFLTLDQSLVATGSYYATIRVADRQDILLCSTYLRSEVVDYTAPHSAPERQVALSPTYLRVGETMQLTGLKPDEETHIVVYSAAGRFVGDYRTLGRETYFLRAEAVEGVYMVYVEDKEKQWVFKYVVVR